MPHASDSNAIEDQLDAALDQILNQGWDEPAAQPPAPNPAEKPVAVSSPPAAGPDHLPLPARDEDEPEEEPADRGAVNIGLLTDLATGRKTAEEVARFAGVTTTDLQDMFAVALRQMPPEEIAKAMGLQAAEQQLKSGALYGAVLADLVADMMAGRLKPDQKLDFAKLLARVGRVEPKEEKGVGIGGGFVLNINLSAADAKPAVTIDAN